MPEIVSTKQCSKCKEIKTRANFYPDKRKADGLQSQCIQCQHEYVRKSYKTERWKEYLAKTRTRRLENAHNWKRKDGVRERLRKSLKKYYESNKQKIKVRAALDYAVRKGRINRPNTCECGNPNPEAHHYKGYAWENRFDVEWKCRACHGKK